MIGRFGQFAAEQHLFPEGGTVLLAVSGGRDSVCMADLMHHSGRSFAIAHCNFHLRPGDCDRDQRFVRQLADDYGVPFHTADFDTRAYAAAHSMGIEEAARHLRYSWFADLCAQHGYPCLATAHHRDDSVETFFLNLFRGTGLPGLHGILPRSVSTEWKYPLIVVRPMLCFSRADIDAYIEDNSLPYVEDSTNAELDARRNRIRLQLMPLLRSLYPSVDATMAGNLSRLRDADLLLGSYIASLRSDLLRPVASRVPAGLHLEAASLEALRCRMAAFADSPSAQRTFVFELLRPYGFNAAQVSEIIDAVADPHTGSRWQSASHIAVIDRGRLLIAPVVRPAEPAVVMRRVDDVDLGAEGVGSRRIYVDADTLCQPVVLRRWRPGDRICPFGMGGRERLVSDVLKDLKLSVVEKEHVYVLCNSQDAIVWIVGLRADDRFSVLRGTKNILELTV